MTRVPPCRITLLGLGILALLGTSPLSAQENGTLTLTVDGETRLLDIVSCTAGLRGAKGLEGEATDDTDTINFVVSEVYRRGPMAQTVLLTSTSTSTAPESGLGSPAKTGTARKRTSLRPNWGKKPPQLLLIVNLTDFAIRPPKSTVVLCA